MAKKCAQRHDVERAFFIHFHVTFFEWKNYCYIQEPLLCFENVQDMMKSDSCSYMGVWNEFEWQKRALNSINDVERAQKMQKILLRWIFQDPIGWTPLTGGIHTYRVKNLWTLPLNNSSVNIYIQLYSNHSFFCAARWPLKCGATL